MTVAVVTADLDTSLHNGLSREEAAQVECAGCKHWQKSRGEWTKESSNC
jgi:hypothetical protein